MNRRILEDVKVNKVKRLIPEQKEEVIVSDPDNHNPTRNLDHQTFENPSKYEFLNKKNIKPSSSIKKIPETPYLPKKRPALNKSLFLILMLALFIGTIYLLSTVFLNAKVNVIAKSKIFELKHQKFTAGKNKLEVPFEIMIISDIESKDIVFTNSKEVSDKAKGEITLYNEYSTKAQKVTAGSFISDENGKTYKTNTTVSIPGYIQDKAKKISPGQISVGITAFLPGEIYNGSPNIFHITSFKGSDKYNKIYGKLKTPLQGGMVGLVYLLGEKEDISTENTALKELLMRKLSAQVPSEYILFPEATNFTSELLETVPSKTPNAKVEKRGTLSAVLFKEEDLSTSIINKLLPDISKEEKLEIIKPDIQSLSFNFINKSEGINKDIENFEFELSGNMVLNWGPDIEKLKRLLANKHKNEVSTIFKQDPGILSAKVNIMPFWSKIFPKDIKNINIIIKKVDEK